jgi:hypothetical protein
MSEFRRSALARLATIAGVALVGLRGADTRAAPGKEANFASVKDFGAKMDGTDESALLQRAIDAQRGKTLIIPDGQITAAGVSLLDATYNNTTIIFVGELLLKARAPARTNFGGAWVGLIIGPCDGVRLIFRGHGNRANQPANEFCHLVGIAGARNLEIPIFRAREIRGDGLYIGQADWLSRSANPSGINIGTFDTYNSADDGRNGLTIVSGDNICIGSFRSSRVGGTINGVTMPGGLDVELDHTYQSVTNLSIGSVAVVTAGTSGLQFTGPGGAATAGVADVSVGSFVVSNTCAPTVADQFSSVTQTNNHCFIVSRGVRNLMARGSASFVRARGDAVIIADCECVHVEVSVRHVREGARIGSDAGVTTGPVKSHIHVNADDISWHGIHIGKAANTIVSGRVSRPVGGHYSTISGVYLLNAAVDNVSISVSVDYSDQWTRTYRREGSLACLNSAIRDCTIHGTYTDWNKRVGDVQLPRINVGGITDQPAMPGGGTWARGTFVQNTVPTVNAGKLLLGWTRLTDGSGNRAGTDWVQVHGLVS